MLKPKVEYITIHFSDLPGRTGDIDQFAQYNGWTKFIRSDRALLLIDPKLLLVDFLDYVDLNEYSYRNANVDAGRLAIQTRNGGTLRVIYGQPSFAEFANDLAMRQKREQTGLLLRPYFVTGHLTKNDNPFNID